MKESQVAKIEKQLQPFSGLVEWYSSVGVGVSFEGNTLQDKDLVALDNVLRSVVWLNLSDTCVTVAGLSSLKNAVLLEAIRVSPKTTKDGIYRLLQLQLQNLDEIDVDETEISDGHLARINAETYVKIVRYGFDNC